jgi:hypothetical protein
LRVAREVNIDFEPNSPDVALATMATNHYDDNADLRAFAKLHARRVEQRGFLILSAGEGQTLTRDQIVQRFSDAGTPLLRATETDYKYDQVYLDRNLHTLPTASRVLDANGAVVSQSTMTYDDAGYSQKLTEETLRLRTSGAIQMELG